MKKKKIRGDERGAGSSSEGKRGVKHREAGRTERPETAAGGLLFEFSREAFRYDGRFCFGLLDTNICTTTYYIAIIDTMCAAVVPMCITGVENGFRLYLNVLYIHTPSASFKTREYRIAVITSTKIRDRLLNRDERASREHRRVLKVVVSSWWNCFLRYASRVNLNIW